MEGINCTLKTSFPGFGKTWILSPHLKKLVQVKFLFLLMLLSSGLLQVAVAQSPQANLDQGNNGNLPGGIHDPVEWVNGNLNESQNHYLEGQSIPYRAVLTRFKVGCETKVRIAFDVRRNSHMAIDYLTSNNWYGPHGSVYPGHPLEAVDPLDGLTGTFSAPTFGNLPGPGTINSPVPGQGQASFLAVQAAGLAKMAIYNGTISSITWVTQPNYLESNASFEAVLEVTFTATALPVVLSWGGHIASRVDWGYNADGPRSAGGIAGSPYHMRLVDWDVTGINANSCSSQTTSIGSQDRSLQISAPPCEAITATIVPNYANYNLNSTVGLQANVTGGFAPYTYAWSSTPGSPTITFNNTTVANPIATIGNTDEATFTVVITDAIGCQVTKTLTIPSPGPLVRPCGIEGPSEVCPNTSSQFSFPHPAATSVSWSVTGNGSINGLNLGTPVTVVSSNVCGGSYTVIVTAVYPNQTVTCSTTVNVLTPLQATFATPPGNVTVACGAIPPVVSLAYSNGTATGGCSIGGSVMGVRSGTYTVCGGTLTDTWTFTDICNRTITASRTITVSPATAATFTNLPGNITLASCSATLPTATTLNYTNGLTGDCLISGTSPMSQIVLTSGTAPCARVYTETWSALDPCQRPITYSRTITVPAAAQAAFVNPPGAITVPCSQAPSTTSSSPLSYSNGLAGACAISGTANSVVTGSSNACGGSYTETWTFADPCGRGTITHSRVITVSAAPLPAFVAPPGSITVACGAVPAVASLTYTNGASGSCSIQGSILGIRTGTSNSCGGVLTDTWTIPAPCPGGQPIVHSRTITVSPAALPTMTAPGPITVACGAIPAASRLTYTNGLTGGCLITGESNLSTFTATPGACGGTVTQTWTATDACGRTIVAVQRVITVSPAALPTMTAPGPITIACGTVPTSSTLSFSNGLTGGCLISGTSNPSTFSATPGACGGTITETWTATDACQRMVATVTRLITVSPAALPTMTAPGPITVACGALPAASTLSYTNGLTGGCLISGTSNLSTFTATPGACGGPVTQTWTATDICGRTIASVTRVITVSPAALPTMTAPGPITVACGARPAASRLTYTNGLTGGCLITGESNLSTFSETPGACGGTITETWTGTDACGRTIAPVSRVITVSPAALPTMTAPGPITVACGAIPAATRLTYTNGLTGGCLITGQSNLSTFTTTPGACGGTVTETWTATDACQRVVASVSRVITVSPAALPTMTAPGPITIACGVVPTSSTLSFSNGLTGGCLISGTSNPSTFSPTPGACGGTITETWTATDACQRVVASVSRTITVSPAALPTMTAPAATTVACGAIPAPSRLTYTNGLTGGCLITGQSNLSTFTTTPGACGGTVTETWTATDACGRTIAPVTRVITVSPAALPTMTPPGPITVACGAIPAASRLTYTNGLTGGCLITGESNLSTFTATPGACGGTVTQTWTATDACGRTIVAVQRVITVSPAALPTMTAPGPITIACGTVPTSSTLSFSNGLTGGCLISGTSNPSTFSATPGACGGTITETWTATDACQRMVATVTRLITVSPAALPTMTAPGPITVACGALPAASTLSYTNGLTGGCLISGTSNLSTFTATPGACGGPVTQTWTATDICGRTIASVSRVITVSPAALPTMTAPGPITVACGAIPAASRLSYTNGLTGGCLISGTSNLSTFTATPGACGGTVTETWTGTDACGRTIAPVSRTITVSPAALPTMTAPGPITVACGALPAASRLAYSNGLTGGCLISGTSNLSTFSTTPGACGGPVTETWTATDPCGRMIATVSRTITVSPAALPTMTAPGPITVACGALPAASTLSYTNGLTGGCLISGTSNLSTFSPTSGACGGPVTQTWTATDPCGRMIATVSRLITVSPAALPTMTAPGPITVACGALPAASTLSYTNGLTGGCLISGTSNPSTFTTIPGRCGGTVTQTWTGTDACGRTIAPVSRVITISPAAPAVFVNAPGNITATVCGVAPTPTSLTYSNGLTGSCAITGSVMSVITGGSANNCGTYTETWSFTDPCGRGVTTHVRTIEVPCCQACTYTQGAYGSAGGNHCNGDGTTSVSLTQIRNAIQNVGGSFTFGSTATNRYWKIYTADAANIMNEMLPGGGNSQIFAQRVGGGTYAQMNTWNVAPLQVGGNNSGKIKNTLFAQTLTLFLSLNFNTANGIRLGNMVLSDTILTKASSSCNTATGVPVGEATKFGIPHEVIVYLNSSNVDVYPTTVAGLFKLANDVLGGVVTNINPGVVAEAVDVVNNAFDECRFLVGRIPYVGTAGKSSVLQSPAVEVTAHPNPFTDRVVFTIKSTVSGSASFDLYGLLGEKVTTLYQGFIEKGAVKTLVYEVPSANRKTMVYQLRIGKDLVTGKVIYPN